mgnify:FL=1
MLHPPTIVTSRVPILAVKLLLCVVHRHAIIEDNDDLGAENLLRMEANIA